MTTSLDDLLRSWAQQVLGVTESGEQARSAFLGKLADTAFVPTPELHAAFETYLRPGGGTRRDERALYAVEGRLRAEVAEFAQRFFSMPPAERRTRWQELETKCQTWPALAARLRELAPGLDAEPASLRDRDPQVNELAVWMGEIFVLPPAQRVQRRQELYQRLTAENWRLAARRLGNRYGVIAGLERHLLSQIESRATRQGIARNARTQASGRRPVSSSKGSVVGLGVTLLVLGIFRIFSALGSATSPTVPHEPWPPPHDLRPPVESWEPLQFVPPPVDASGAPASGTTPPANRTTPAATTRSSAARPSGEHR